MPSASDVNIIRYAGGSVIDLANQSTISTTSFASLHLTELLSNDIAEGHLAE